MKKLLFILLVSVSFVACSSGPENAAKNFTENLAKGNFEEAKKYAAPQTAALLDMAAGMAGDKMPNYADYKFKMVKDSVAGDAAWVTYITPDGKEEVINLVKIDGDWKVSVGK